MPFGDKTCWNIGTAKDCCEEELELYHENVFKDEKQFLDESKFDNVKCEMEFWDESDSGKLNSGNSFLKMCFFTGVLRED